MTLLDSVCDVPAIRHTVAGVFVWMRWDTNPRLLRLLQLQHPFGPGQVVHLLEGLHLSPEGAAGGVIERVVGGGVVCWARLQGEAGLLGYRRWKRFATDGSITADCAAGARVQAPGVCRTWSCSDLQEHQELSYCLWWASETPEGRTTLTLGGSGTNDGGGLGSRCTSLLAGFFKRSWGTGMGLCVKVKKSHKRSIKLFKNTIKKWKP